MVVETGVADEGVVDALVVGGRVALGAVELDAVAGVRGDVRLRAEATLAAAGRVEGEPETEALLGVLASTAANRCLPMVCSRPQVVGRRTPKS